MAKRKRLSAPGVTPDGMAPPADGPAPEVKSMSNTLSHALSDIPVGLVPAASLRRRAPIADVAGQAALSDALDRVSGELIAAKSEGRMAVKIPLDHIDATHIMRDRSHADPAEMEVLMASLAARGQQSPIEVVETKPGRFGLISGWRRVQALRALATNTGTPPEALAFVRTPRSASDAYTAMIEENEIRVGLSYFERASIVARVVDAGVFDNVQAALATLFATASRAKRSKIKSFLPLVESLGGYCHFPHAISERMGLALSARISTDPAFVTRLRDRLRKADPQDAAQEMALIEKALADKSVKARPAPTPAPTPAQAAAGSPADLAHDTAAPSILVRHARGRITLEGPGVSDALAREIEQIVQNWTE